jgi:aminoglycoside phosphotransferase (APT) family kinase protein
VTKNEEVKSLAEKMNRKSKKMVLCHTDAHGFNLIQGDNLFLVDWESIKVAPAEVDLVMFSKKDYWDIFIKHYLNLRPDFELDSEILIFFILRRKIEDIWDFIASILYDELTIKEREGNLAYLANCCKTLDDCWFEL